MIHTPYNECLILVDRHAGIEREDLPWDAHVVFTDASIPEGGLRIISI